jgi:predicted phage tail protein
MDLSKIDNDFEESEVEKINTFISNGCIGLSTLSADESKVNGMFALYMQGRSYTDISKTTKVKKDLVLYMSAKMNWYEKRMEHLNDIQKNIMTRLTDTKIQSLDFISNLITAQHKYYGDEISKFIMTGDRTVMENLDLKQLTQYFKSIEILEKILNPANVKKGGGSSSIVNINAPDGAEIKKLDENTVEITPGGHGELLRKLSELKDIKNKEE